MPQTLDIEGKRYVVLPQEEFERLSRAARLPALPEPDENGTYPALEYGRASLARKIILRRESLGWTQTELARRAGIHKETLCRLETGKVTPTIATVEKIETALAANSQRGGRRRRKH